MGVSVGERMSVWMISFADSKYGATAVRLRGEAMAMDMAMMRESGTRLFADVTIWNENVLKGGFWETYHDWIMRYYYRGYGYWIWKPYVVLKALSRLRDGDILFYCDVGCSLNVEGLKRFQEYVDETRRSPSGILGFHLPFPESHYTKYDTLDHLDFTSPSQTSSSQIMSGVFFVEKSRKTEFFFEEWLRLCVCDNFHHVDDSPSNLPNDPQFVEHRHDQSIFSILMKQQQSLTIPDEFYFEPHWDAHRHFPIHTRRLKY